MCYFISPFYFRVPFRLSDYFNNRKRFSIEIGFGNGDFMLYLARKEADYGYLGVEISSRSVLKLTKKLITHKIDNVKTIKFDAYMLFSIIDPPFSVNRVIYNFPDPWPDAPEKRVSFKKHLLLIHRVLRKDGAFYLATDSDVLKEDIEKNAREMFCIEKQKEPYFDFRTKYETRWISQKKEVLYYRLVPAPYRGEYPVLKIDNGGSNMSHVVFSVKVIDKNLKLPLPRRVVFEDETLVLIGKPYTGHREYLYPVLVKEKGFVQKTYFKLYFVHSEARMVPDDTSYLVITRGIRRAMAVLRDLLLNTGNFVVKRDTT